MNEFFISKSYAQSTENIDQNNSKTSEFSLSSVIPFVLIFVVFYVLIIRPQNKKLKEHQKTLDEIKLGDKIITSSGIIGVVKQIYEKEKQVLLEVSEGVAITILKQAISEVENSRPNLQKPEKKGKKSRS